jgi:hypothetical protein
MQVVLERSGLMSELKEDDSVDSKQGLQPLVASVEFRSPNEEGGEVI